MTFVRSGPIAFRRLIARVLACASFTSVLAMVAGARAEEKPKVQDYDGRPKRTTTGDVLIWVPRIVALPFYVVTEFVFRKPLGAITKGVENANEPSPKSAWTFSPIVSFDAGFRPWLGVHVRRERVFTRENEVHAEAAFGGVHTLLLGLGDQLALTKRLGLSLSGIITRRDDAIFHGVGPQSSPDTRTRFGYDRLELSLGLQLAFGPGSSFHSAVGLRGTRFSDPAEIGTRDYAVAFQGLALTLDTRHDVSRLSTGARLELDGEHAIDTAADRHARFLRFGGATTLSLDLTGQHRVLSFSLAARFVETLSGAPPPVTELVILGGDRYLRGFLYGRLYGQSAVVAALSYQWPIWVWLDGFLSAEVGDVFGAHLQGFEPRLLRTSYTTGVRAPGNDATVEVLGGIGTETFADGLRVSSGRFLVTLSRPL